MISRGLRVLLAAMVGVALLGAQTAAPAASSGQVPSQRTIPAGNGTVRGTVKDASGAVVPGAKITLTDANNSTRTVVSGGDGSYAFHGIAPGTYSVSAAFTGLEQQTPLAISLASGQSRTANIVMAVQTEKQTVTVTDTTTNVVSTDAANNTSALVLKPEDLDALPDDPDDMEADLTALAGPSAGPGGNQIFIDGFTGGRLPPKASIREIRINSNPFSAEFDKLGYGRIQIFTKPGSDKFHGQAYYNISDDIWDSRNPFLSVNPPFRTQLFGGNVSGPITKKASFFLDVERRNIDDNGIITASLPNNGLLGYSSYQNYYSTPQRRTTVSPRIDYQLSSNNTLSFRYGWLDNEHIVTGISAFDIPALSVTSANGSTLNYPSSGYSSSVVEQTFQAVDTMVLNAKAINETHFQFDRESTTEASQSNAPQLSVGQAFTAGGSGYSAAGYPNTFDLQNNYELQNYTSITWGSHTTKAGIRIRADNLSDSSPKSFNGTYSFLGGTFPELSAALTPIPGQTVQLLSIDQYLLTERLLESGMSSQAVTALGYGPSKYQVNVGNPYLSFYQLDFGPFVQDDWKVRPNLTLSFGLRWEAQTNINDKNDWAPRFAFAWSPDGRGPSSRPKTVIRGGWGYFYDRFAITNVESAYRYNQEAGSQTAYTLNNPGIYNENFDTPIPLADLTAASAPNAAQRYQIDSNLKAPRLMQTAVSVERQLFSHTTFNANFVNSRGTHELRTVDINAPVPIVGQLPPGSPNAGYVGVRPYGNIGDIYNFESDGTFKQTQVVAGVNSQVGKWLTLFSRFSWNNAHSDTDGLGTLPSNPYNFAADWGRSSLNIEKSLFIGGSISMRWGIRLSPFLIARTGIPYNISTGTDLYDQGSVTPTARPSIVDTTTPYPSPFGYLNPDPIVAAPGVNNMIVRNAATGPSFVGLNLRLSKTWGFGTTKFSGPSGGARSGGGGRHGGGGGGGFRGDFASTEHRYNVSVGINARNILNHANLNTPNGALTSPYFLQSTGITGGYGAESTASNQRRIDLQLRFTF
ncbi:MAG TPA: carboxypeptidase-like regulatory domain-containing protein [Bryobacteraceae bacterium]|nr:carboxypeptidase-like regulatory domain-containing protein [Bryobacteraceae bacterium]